jgi:RimJ/RimL family protein N-acetyltransferase
VAETEPENAASQRVLARIGMRPLDERRWSTA